MNSGTLYARVLSHVAHSNAILKTSEHSHDSLRNDCSDSDAQRNAGQAGGTPGLDLNVEAAWALNITGRGVTTAIMDDGIDYLHPDLADNYVRHDEYVDAAQQLAFLFLSAVSD